MWQISSIYQFTQQSFELSYTCLLSGPTLSSILQAASECYLYVPNIKIEVQSQDLWSDMVCLYKDKLDFKKKLRISLDNQPAIDTGGVRRQVYTSVFTQFATNEHFRLFDGPNNCLRPACTADARSSGLLKILGSMVAHSVCQDGVGFPYLSQTCYAYVAGGEERALKFATLEDLPMDSAGFISQVCVYNPSY